MIWLSTYQRKYSVHNFEGIQKGWRCGMLEQVMRGFTALSLWQGKKKKTKKKAWSSFWKHLSQATKGLSGKWKHFYSTGTSAEQQDNEVTGLLPFPKQWDLAGSSTHSSQCPGKGHYTVLCQPLPPSLSNQDHFRTDTCNRDFLVHNE